MSERQIDDINPEGGLVRRCELQCGNDRARRARAVLVEHLEANQTRFGSNALIEAQVLLTAARAGRRDVRSMPIVVVGLDCLAALCEVVKRGDLILEIGKTSGNSGVDDRNPDAVAGDTFEQAS